MAEQITGDPLVVRPEGEDKKPEAPKETAGILKDSPVEGRSESREEQGVEETFDSILSIPVFDKLSEDDVEKDDYKEFVKKNIIGLSPMAVKAANTLPPEDRKAFYQTAAAARVTGKEIDDPSLGKDVNDSLLVSVFMNFMNKLDKSLNKEGHDLPGDWSEGWRDYTENPDPEDSQIEQWFKSAAQELPGIVAAGLPGAYAAGKAGAGIGALTGNPAVAAVGALVGGSLGFAFTSAMLEEGSSEGPENKHGFIADLAANMFEIDSLMESEEEREQRIAEHQKDPYLKRIWNRTAADAIDDFALFGAGKLAGKTIKGVAKSKVFNNQKGMALFTSKKGANRAQEIIDTNGLTRVSRAEKEQAINLLRTSWWAKNGRKVKFTKVKTADGKNAVIAYKPLTEQGGLPNLPTDGALTPPPIPVKGLIDKTVGVNPLQGTKALYNAAREALQNNDMSKLAEMDSIRKALIDSDAFSKAGQTGPLRDIPVDYIARSYAEAQVALIRAIQDGGDTLFPRQVLASLGAMVDGGIKGTTDIAQAIKTGAGVDLQRAKMLNDVMERIGQLGIDYDDLVRKDPRTLRFLENLYDGIAKGTVSAEDVAVRVGGHGTLDGFVDAMNRSVHSFRLTYSAVAKTALGNAGGVVNTQLSSAFRHGLFPMLGDTLRGTSNVLRLVGDGVLHPVDGIRGVIRRASGTLPSDVIADRSFAKHTLPKTAVGKVWNTLTGTPFEAMGAIDNVTKAYLAPFEARNALDWMTDHRLTKMKVDPSNSRAYKKLWYSERSKLIQELNNGDSATATEFLSLGHRFMEEGANKVAYRRNLSNSMTPVGWAGSKDPTKSYYVKMYKLLEELNNTDNALGRFAIQTLFVPFAKTGLNMAETLSRSVKAVTPFAKGNLHMGARKDALMAPGAIALGLYYYEQSKGLGIVGKAGYGPAESERLARQVKGGLQRGHVRVGDRQVPIDTFNQLGQFLGLVSELNRYSNILEDVEPRSGKEIWQPIVGITSKLGGVEVMHGLSDFVKIFDSEDQALYLLDNTIGRAIEDAFPLASHHRNYQEVKGGYKESRYGMPLSEGIKSLENMKKYWDDLIENAYGKHGFVNRDIFGAPVNAIHPDDVGEEASLVDTLVHTMFGGLNVVTEEETEFFVRLREMGLFTPADAHIPLNEKEAVTYDKAQYLLRSPSKSIPVKLILGDKRRPVIEKGSLKLHNHEYNIMKGLMGLDTELWDSLEEKLDRRERLETKQRRKALFRMLKNSFGYKKGDSLKDMIKRIALAERGKGPRYLKSQYRAMRYTPQFGGKYFVQELGEDKQEYWWKQAQRRTIVKLHKLMVKQSQTVIKYWPSVRQRGEDYNRLKRGLDSGG